MANVNQISEAVILCGGKGTRLRNVVSDVPKPLAPINGTPFLSILMHSLVVQGIKRIILASGYMHQKIVVEYLRYMVKNQEVMYPMLKLLILTTILIHQK